MSSDEPIQTNAADEAQIALGVRGQREERKEQAARWRVQLSTEAGRRFVWDEIFAAGYLFAHIESDEIQKLGVRNRMLKFWGLSQEHVDLFLQMQNEAMKRESARRRTRRSERTIATREGDHAP
jgi:hypothetical protein